MQRFFNKVRRLFRAPNPAIMLIDMAVQAKNGFVAEDEILQEFVVILYHLKTPLTKFDASVFVVRLDGVKHFQLVGLESRLVKDSTNGRITQVHFGTCSAN